MLLLGVDNTIVVQKDHTLVPSVPQKSSRSGWFMGFSWAADVLLTGLASQTGLTAPYSVAHTRTPKLNPFE